MNKKLTPREIEICTALLRGETSKELALRLCLGKETIKTHIRNLLRKMNYRCVWEMRLGHAHGEFTEE
jgi:DNA-binding NarL/FixJ family response regulator